MFGLRFSNYAPKIQYYVITQLFGAKWNYFKEFQLFFELQAKGNQPQIQWPLLQRVRATARGYIPWSAPAGVWVPHIERVRVIIRPRLLSLYLDFNVRGKFIVSHGCLIVYIPLVSISLGAASAAVCAAYLLPSYLHCREILLKNTQRRASRPTPLFKTCSFGQNEAADQLGVSALGIKRKSGDGNNYLPGREF